jgi:hypothetical protein
MRGLLLHIWQLIDGSTAAIQFRLSFVRGDNQSPNNNDQALRWFPNTNKSLMSNYLREGKFCFRAFYMSIDAE